MLKCDTGITGGLVGLLASTVGISLTIELVTEPIRNLVDDKYTRLDLLGMDALMVNYTPETSGKPTKLITASLRDDSLMKGILFDK